MIEAQPKPILVEADRDIRTRTVTLVMSGPLHGGVVRPVAGEYPAGKPPQLGPSEILQMTVATEDAPGFVRSIVDAFVNVGVHVPSAAAEIRRLEDHITDLRLGLGRAYEAAKPRGGC